MQGTTRCLHAREIWRAMVRARPWLTFLMRRLSTFQEWPRHRSAWRLSPALIGIRPTFRSYRCWRPSTGICSCHERCWSSGRWRIAKAEQRLRGKAMQRDRRLRMEERSPDQPARLARQRPGRRYWKPSAACAFLPLNSLTGQPLTFRASNLPSKPMCTNTSRYTRVSNL